MGPCSKARADGPGQLGRKRSGLVRGFEIFAQVHNLNGRQRAIFHARFQLQQLIFSGARILKTFQRRRGRAQQGDAALELGAHDGNVSPVVARRFFLFVAPLLLLVHHDQTEIFKRSEHRRACSHHHAGLAATHSPPFARALHFTERAVQHRDTGTKPCAAQPPNPQRQRNFRNQNQRRLVARQRRLHRPQVHFRFATTGNSEEQTHLEGICVNPALDFCELSRLVRIQDVGGWRVVHFK